MRTILLAVLVAMGIGLAGTAGVSAAPANGGVLRDLSAAPMAEQAQYYYYRRRWRRHRRHCRSYRVCNYYGRCWWQRRCW